MGLIIFDILIALFCSFCAVLQFTRENWVMFVIEILLVIMNLVIAGVNINNRRKKIGRYI